MNKAVIILCVLGLAILSQKSPTAVAAKQLNRVVKIGCMFPMTGRGGLYGRDSVAAINMAIDEIDANPAMAGLKLQVLTEDSKSKPAYAVQIAQRFIRHDKVDFLCGAVSSSVALAVSDVARRHKTIFIGTDHASSRLTLENLHRYYFRVSNNTYQSMAAGALYLADLKQTRPWKTIAFIGPDYEYGHVMWEDLKSKLGDLGIGYKIVGEYWPRLYEPDFAPYIKAILRAKPDILVNGHWGGDAVAFVRQAKSYDLFSQTLFMNFDAGGNYEVMAALGDDMPLGLILSARHHNNWPETSRNSAFVRSFHARTGRYPSYAAEGAYTGIQAIAEAVRGAGGTGDSDRLVKVLEQLRLKLPEDPDGFSSYMDPRTHQMVQMQAIGQVVPNKSFPPETAMLGH